ncbi:hypothetical protein K458DRAFT_407144 [Lentithecium fluviatile CBS 122367]|uniref:Uncharacterized protein n=1 Tax=Lentithecium fluviatile CBS 122367 TaxID=1168545 RepID=A0A6G1IRS3_9PLEO|nr:hypothetical protein K458DRAFT_407144 [Lentithecium fluviatile CBS 122367]
MGPQVHRGFQLWFGNCISGGTEAPAVMRPREVYSPAGILHMGGSCCAAICQKLQPCRNIGGWDAAPPGMPVPRGDFSHAEHLRLGMPVPSGRVLSWSISVGMHEHWEALGTVPPP